ncbi:MAG: hypothetical protein V3T30_01915, partial [Thermodesulfobacteriota bacterium]
MVRKLKTYALLYPLAVLAFSLLLSASVFAAEIRGTVTSVLDSTITIEITGTASPSPGDKVDVGFVTPEGDYVPIGTWRVSRVDGRKVKATKVEAEGEADIDNVAVIHTSARSTKTQNSETRQAAGDSKGEEYYKKGRAYVYGEGVDIDYAAAMKWSKKAADLGNAGGMNNVGYLYSNGFGISEDPFEA